MASAMDFSDPLREEMLSQMADTFFRRRRGLEREMDLIHEAAERLRRRQQTVEECAALVHHLLVEREEAEAFWKRLGVEAAPFFTDRAPGRERISSARPFALGPARRYRKWVERAYRQLRRERDAYMDGEGPGGPGDDASEPAEYYRLLEEMTRLVNEHIRDTNQGCRVSTTLQTAKQFDPQKMDRERTTGATSELFAPGLDDRLCFRPLDFEALGLQPFPAIPPWGDAERRVKGFLGQCFRRHRSEIRRRTAALRTPRNGIDKRR